MNDPPKKIEVYRRMTPQQRLQVGFDLSALSRILVRLKIRHQFTEWSEEKIAKEIKRRFWQKLVDDPEVEDTCTRLYEEMSLSATNPSQTVT